MEISMTERISVSDIPRAEYPNPQFARKNWINLNGEWEFERDRAVSGKAKGLQSVASLTDRIIVPFCMESTLSGIGDKDFCECVWYKREITVPESWLEKGKRVFLHIGACDYKTEVYVNGSFVGDHIGGYISFAIDITSYLGNEKNIITIRAEDRVRSNNQPAGKQSTRYNSYGCFYTRTTGIWQTVRLECVPSEYIKGVKYYPDINDSSLLAVITANCRYGSRIDAEASFNGKTVGKAFAYVTGGSCAVKIKLDELHLWNVGDGKLYDLKLKLGDDEVSSYFGMRSVAAHNGMLYINGKRVFQRLILDQGFYPDGIYTAPSENELINDITRSMDMGFNGARLHQKIFEPLFLYHCDRLGYIVWGEHGSFGLDISRKNCWEGFIPEWLEALERDFNHPSVIGWCPLNETQSDQNSQFVSFLVKLTKTIDTTRPVIDASGWHHEPGAETDFIDWHDYDQNPETFRKRYEDCFNGSPIKLSKHTPFPLMPTFISEYGGIKWDINSENKDAWGYGDTPQTPEEFKQRFKGLTEALLFNPHIGGLCYTQLTDVEQEMNGLYTYDRKPKFDPEFFKQILSQKAAIED